ncbi:hypothetical protein [Streptomyces reticuliscabiei]|uniref:hypothetical protein n=1 Tax=Streptomyces reticuliscabiei TaxID=146821 RepID=UPI00117C92D1|nr:hypothetical protein [Streptomyces reticuliscabiei]
MAVTTSPLSRELPAGLLPAAPAQHPDTWLQELLSRQGPEFESVRLLGDAWRSPAATAVQLGRDFDFVEVPQEVASPAWHHLRRRTVQCGAVFASGARWSFIVPSGFGDLPWPAEARYLTDCDVFIPARGARDETYERWWISRPPSGPFTYPLALVAALNAFVGSSSSTLASVTHPACSPTAGPLSPPLCSPGV